MNLSIFIHDEVNLFINRIVRNNLLNDEDAAYLKRNTNQFRINNRIRSVSLEDLEDKSHKAIKLLLGVRVKCLADLVDVIECWVFLMAIHAIHGITEKCKTSLMYVLDRMHRMAQLQKKFPSIDEKVDRILALSSSKSCEDEVELLTLQEMIKKRNIT